LPSEAVTTGPLLGGVMTGKVGIHEALKMTGSRCNKWIGLLTIPAVAFFLRLALQMTTTPEQQLYSSLRPIYRSLPLLSNWVWILADLCFDLASLDLEWPGSSVMAEHLLCRRHHNGRVDQVGRDAGVGRVASTLVRPLDPRFPASLCGDHEWLFLGDVASSPRAPR
jgi:hypothetical protein